MKNIKNSETEWIREAGASNYYDPIYCELLFSRNMYVVQKELLGVSENLFTFVSEEKTDGAHTNHTMWHKNNIAWISSHMLKIVEENKNFLDKFLDKFEKIKYLNYENLKIKNFNNFKTILLMMKEGGGLQMMTQPHSVEKIENKTLELLGNLKIEESPRVILNILTQPMNLSSITKERIEYLKLLINFDEKGVNDIMIKQHFEKYLPCFSSESIKNNLEINVSWLKLKIEKDLNKKSKEDFEKEHFSILQNNRKAIEKKENLIKEYKFTKRILNLCHILEVFSEIRLESHLIWMIWYFQIEQLIIEKAKRLNVPEMMVRNMTLEEFEAIDNIENLNKHPRKISDKKVDLFVIHIDEENNHQILFEQEAKEFLDFKKIKLGPSDELLFLKGDSAFPGIVKGRVKLIDERESLEIQMKDMDEGDILVAWQTKPHMLPAILKSSAIVTNEGGITSHAAIIAREFKKPCVVMTRWATDFLKDGDFVEVNADEGVIYKIDKEEFYLKDSKEKNIIWFKDIQKEDILIVGGKGANLGELFDKFLVPLGFCITTKVYNEFIYQNKIKDKIKNLTIDLELKNLEEIESVSKKIKHLILEGEFTRELKSEIMENHKKLKVKDIAIRSTAITEDLPTMSFAGQHDSYLNINEPNLLQKIKECWASLFSTRAIYYRIQNKISSDKLSIAVIVQEMIDPNYAGVMFTINPVDKEHLLIEAVKGLGNKLVEGEGQPNSYKVNKDTGEIIVTKEQFKLDKKIVSRIAQDGMRIEKHYNVPQDIEWAIDEHERIWILQSRAITTL